MGGSCFQWFTIEYQVTALGNLETGPKLGPKCRRHWGKSGIGRMGYGYTLGEQRVGK
jgi:hypothetical protein